VNEQSFPDIVAPGCDEAAILRRLRKTSLTGDSLRAELGLSHDAFERAARSLWDACALQGDAKDGCCGDPCGPHCVAAFKRAWRWRLTKKGEAMVKAAPRVRTRTSPRTKS
jgi:hypothetical protein